MLAGRSGSGKTTLLRACCGLVPHYHGGEVERRDRGRGPRRPSSTGPPSWEARSAWWPRTRRPRSSRRRCAASSSCRWRCAATPPAARARAVEEVALALAIPHLLDRTVGHALGRRAPASRPGGGAGRPAAAGPARRADLAARPGGRRRADLAAAAPERGVGGGGGPRRAPAGALPGGGRPRARDGSRAGSPSTARRGTSSPGRSAHDGALATPGGAAVRPGRASALCRSAVKRARAARCGAPASSSRSAGPARGADGRASRPAGAAAVDRALALARSLGRARRRRGAHATSCAASSSTSQPGERVALMGRNGAGKTHPAAGRGRAASSRRAAGSTRARGCALLPQSPSDSGPRAGRRRASRRGRAAAPCASVGLEWAADADPRDLSGGERQRLALAIVLAGRMEGGRLPGLVALDEPTRGMDRARKEELASWSAGSPSAAPASSSPPTTSSSRPRSPSGSCCSATAIVIADGPAAEILSGGWYFATEVARILDVPGVDHRRSRAPSSWSRAAARLDAGAGDDAGSWPAS